MITKLYEIFCVLCKYVKSILLYYINYINQVIYNNNIQIYHFTQYINHREYKLFTISGDDVQLILI